MPLPAVFQDMELPFLTHIFLCMLNRPVLFLHLEAKPSLWSSLLLFWVSLYLCRCMLAEYRLLYFPNFFKDFSSFSVPLVWQFLSTKMNWCPTLNIAYVTHCPQHFSLESSQLNVLSFCHSKALAVCKVRD